MAVFSGFRPFLTKGSTVNGVQNIFFSDSSQGFHYLPEMNVPDVYSASNIASFGNSVFSTVDKKSKFFISNFELMKNGTFNTAADWSFLLATDFSITNGSLIYTGATGQSRAHGTLVNPVVANKSYLVEFDITITSGPISGDIRFRTGTGGSLSTSVAFNSGGRFSTILTATDSHTTLGIFGYSGAFSINNVSVRELSGNPAVQSTASLRPLLGRAPRIRTNLINNSEDLTTWTLANVTTTANKVMENTTVEMHVARAGAPEIYFNTDYYFTVEVKAAEKSYAVVGAWWTGGVAAGGVIINLTNGTFAGDWSRSPGNVSATFLGSDNVGDGWWRIRVYINNLSNLSPAHPIVGLTNSTTSVVNEFYAGTAGHGVFVRKAHASLTPFTVYQKTESNRLIATSDTQTSYPFIRLDLSDDVLTTANLVSQRNLLRYTEEFSNAYWTKNSGTVTPNTVIAPNGTLTASTFAPSAQYSSVTRADSRPLGTYTFSVYMRVDSGTRTISIGCIADGLYFKMGDRTVTNTWQRFSYTFTHDNPSWSIGGVIQDRNTSGFVNVYIWGAQLELASTATDYDYGGVKGTVVVAGKNGSTTSSDIRIPDGNFSLGPASYTGGTPGILRAVGDIVGYSLIGRSTTVVEQDQLLDFYKFRGSKGILTPGPELQNQSVIGSVQQFDGTAYNRIHGYFWGNLTGAANFTPDKCFIITGAVKRLSGSGVFRWRSERGTNYSIEINPAIGETFSYTVVSQLTTSSFSLAGWNVFMLEQYNNNTSQIELVTLSVKELRPEEEW